jgi:hypothetical protein
MLQTQQSELEGFPDKDFENPEEGTTQKWKNKTAETKKSTSSMKKSDKRGDNKSCMHHGF